MPGKHPQHSRRFTQQFTHTETLMTEQAFQQALARITALEVKTGITITLAQSEPQRLPDGAILLPDGTKQFPYAPTGGNGNTQAGYTPPIAASWGKGATFTRKGVPSDAAKPFVVTRTGDGGVWAEYTDDEGTREVFFMEPQIDQVSAAPQEADEG